MGKMTNCKACGEEIAKGAKVCPKCGKDQRNFFMKHKIITGIIALIVLFGAGGAMSGGSSTSSKTSTSNATNATKDTTVKPTDYSIKEGMYKVGTDIPAGEYVVVAEANGYMQVSKDSTGDINSIVTNENIQNRTIVTVKDGQYLTATNGKIYPIDKAPKVDTSSGILPSGMYKVGVDIQPGEYKVSADANGYVEVAKNSLGSIDSIVSNDNFTGDKYITVAAGEYLKITNATLKLK